MRASIRHDDGPTLPLEGAARHMVRGRGIRRRRRLRELTPDSSCTRTIPGSASRIAISACSPSSGASRTDKREVPHRADLVLAPALERRRHVAGLQLLEQRVELGRAVIQREREPAAHAVILVLEAPQGT